MTGVEKLFLYWPGRHNLGPEWQCLEIYRPGKPPGCISPGHLDRVSAWHTKTGYLHRLYLVDHGCLQCLFVRASNKQHRAGRIISNFTKGETFSSLMTTRCSWM